MKIGIVISVGHALIHGIRDGATTLDVDPSTLDETTRLRLLAAIQAPCVLNRPTVGYWANVEPTALTVLSWVAAVEALAASEQQEKLAREEAARVATAERSAHDKVIQCRVYGAYTELRAIAPLDAKSEEALIARLDAETRGALLGNRVWCNELRERRERREEWLANLRHDVRRQVILAVGTLIDVARFDAKRLDKEEETLLREAFLFPGFTEADMSRVANSDAGAPPCSMEQWVGREAILQELGKVPAREGWVSTVTDVELSANGVIRPGLMVEAVHAEANLVAFITLPLSAEDGRALTAASEAPIRNDEN